MKHYKVKTNVGVSPAMAKLDAERRAKAEKGMSRPFTDQEWREYKFMTMPKAGRKK